MVNVKSKGEINIKKLVSILILFSILLVSCTNNTSNENTLNLYVADSNVSTLKLHETNIPKANLEEIIPETIKLNESCFNQDTKVLNVMVKDKIAYVDLSKEFDDPNTNSSAIALLKVFSIVNSLCLNKSLNIDGVYFLIEGVQQEVVAGMGVNGGGPFTGREDL